jgi:hypothetical protein
MSIDKQLVTLLGVDEENGVAILEVRSAAPHAYVCTRHCAPTFYAFSQTG